MIWSEKHLLEIHTNKYETKVQDNVPPTLLPVYSNGNEWYLRLGFSMVISSRIFQWATSFPATPATEAAIQHVTPFYMCFRNT